MDTPPHTPPPPPTDDELHAAVKAAAAAKRIVILERAQEQTLERYDADDIFDMLNALRRDELFANEPDDKGRSDQIAKYDVPRVRWDGVYGLYIKIALRLPAMAYGRVLSFKRRKPK